MEEEVKSSAIVGSGEPPKVTSQEETKENTKVETPTTITTNQLSEVKEEEVDFDEEDDEEVDSASKEVGNSKGANVDNNIQTTSTSTKKSQSREENSKYAEMRRAEREKKKAELEKQSYNKGVLEATNGINPYTQEKIVSDEDIEEFRNMQEMSKKGLDPILDYHKFVKQKQLEVKEAKAKEEQAKVQQEQVVKQAQEKYTSDVNDFKSKNPEIDVEKELWQNTKFMKFADGKIGRYALDTIYKDYVAFTSEYENNAKEKAKQMVAINRTSSGSLTGAEVSQKTKDYASMSKEDFEREYKKITGR